MIQRNRDRSSVDNETLRRIGTVRSQLRWIELTTSAVVAAVVITIALLTMLVASPVGPVGPLHDLDPAQGFSVDVTTAVAGTVTILLTIGLITVGTPLVRTVASRRSRSHSRRPNNASLGAAAVAGLTLAFRPEGGRSWRPVAATTLATIVLAICATFVPSAISLTATPSRYGFSADLVAVNAYGDQSVAALVQAFRNTDDVDAATGHLLVPFVIEGRAVPGLATTAIKGDLTPTLLEGRPARTDREIVVGNDTLDSIDADVGDVVTVQIAEPANDQGNGIDLRIVGVATFPPVNQVGSDVPRLGVGALITRSAYLRMGGDGSNGPEFTMVRLADGSDPAAVIARIPDGFRDAAHTTTTWFNGTKPAEIRQLDAAMPYLRASLVVGYAVLVAVITHALWTCARSNRHALAVLRAIGCTSRQLNAIAAWQVLPAAFAATARRDPARRRPRSPVVRLLRPVTRRRRHSFDNRRHGRCTGGRCARRRGDRQSRQPDPQSSESCIARPCFQYAADRRQRAADSEIGEQVVADAVHGGGLSGRPHARRRRDVRSGHSRHERRTRRRFRRAYDPTHIDVRTISKRQPSVSVGDLHDHRRPRGGRQGLYELAESRDR